MDCCSFAVCERSAASKCHSYYSMMCSFAPPAPSCALMPYRHGPQGLVYSWPRQELADRKWSAVLLYFQTEDATVSMEAGCAILVLEGPCNILHVLLVSQLVSRSSSSVESW